MSLPPVATAHLFPGERDALLALLRDLSSSEWNAMTICEGWNVHDVSLHLLGGDIGWLSGGRDRFHGSPTAPASPSGLDDLETLVGWIDGRNAVWIDATRRVSPALLVDLLGFTGERLAAWIPTLDLEAPGIPVSWAGTDPAPTWLHVAREYTERWTHQQHIRDAIGRPGLTEPEWLGPVLDTFARALPHTLRNLHAPEGTTVALRVTGLAGEVWCAERRSDAWCLVPDIPERPGTLVTMDEETAWRGFTRGIGLDRIRSRTRVDGDREAGDAIMRMVSIIA